MYPYLVSPSGFGQRFHYTVISRAPQQAEPGICLFAPVFVDDGPVLLVAAGDQGKLAESFAGGKAAVNHRDIQLGGPPFLKGCGKPLMGFRIFGEHHHARSIPVYAVYGKNRRLTMGRKKPVQPLTRIIPPVASNGKSGSRVYRDNMIVFINNGKERRRFHADILLFLRFFVRDAARVFLPFHLSATFGRYETLRVSYRPNVGEGGVGT
jgi:hypothetical protein